MTASTHSLLQARPTPLPMFVAGSVAAHVLGVCLWLLVGWLMAGPKVDIDQKPIKATLVRLGKPRDDKLLPRKEPEPPPPAPKVQEVAIGAPAPVVDTAVKIPTKDAKPPEKAVKKDGDAKKSLFDAFAKGGKQTKPEELEGEADGDLNGDSAKQEGEKYFGLLNSVVKRNYDVSNTIDEAERRRLRAEVALRIGPGGELIDVSVTRASGNELFDSAVLGAVKKAAPFSAPPEHLRDSLKKNGVAIVFTP